MPTALRDSLLLVCGVLLGIVAGAAIILFLNLGPDQAEAPRPAPSAAATETAAPSTATMGAGPAPAQAAAPASHVACPLRPLLAVAGAKDGQLLPPADVSRTGLDEAERMLLAGKEAAAAGKVRDAEVAYLTSCRIADNRKGAGSVEAATARYQLARHYAGLATAQGNVPPAERDELRRRAQAFYTDSLQSFRSTLGPAHEKTRFAAEGLAALQQPASAQAVPAPAVVATPTRKPAPPPVATAEPAPPAVRASVRESTAARPAEPPVAARETSRAAPPPAARREPEPAQPAVRQATGDPGVPGAPEGQEPSARPSFDCSRARSVPEKIICGDAELSQLDRNLGRLHSRAKDAAPDPAAFKRRNDDEWRRRESTCRDRDCLLDWYEQRRRQLQEELSDAGGGGRATASR